MELQRLRITEDKMVFLDDWDWLADKNTRSLVPPYDENAAIRAVGEMVAGK